MTTPQQFTHADDLIAVWRHYIQSVLAPPDGEADPACKALVADDNAMRALTVACPMTLLMEHRIYDIHSLEQLLDAGHRSALTGEETVRFLLCTCTRCGSQCAWPQEGEGRTCPCFEPCECTFL